MQYLTYQLIKECCLNEEEKYIGYGILLTKVSDKKIIEIAVFKDLTSLKEKAVKFLKLLSESQIKPYQVYEFVEDFLA